MSIDVVIRIGGQAGQGIQSISSVIGKIFSRHGYYVFINQDAESRIRGGHNFNQVRIKKEIVRAVSEKVHLLIALDKVSIERDLPFLADNGVMIFDESTEDFTSDNPNHFPIPMGQLIREAGGNKIMVNSMASGAALALMGLDIEPLKELLEEQFAHKGEEVANINKKIAATGYQYVIDNFKGTDFTKLSFEKSAKSKMLISGSEAMALGAVCAGLKFYAGYPMSPSTSVMEFIAAKAEEKRIVVEHVEDEISAINMAIGASFAGVRAMTATSGGGFCLMVEGLGLAGMTETPLVVVVAQRPGPATGLPTRTEQSDLSFVVNASHGEFPRAVFAPGDAEQAFYVMGKAFNMADRYQTPVIVLGDQHLNDSYFTIDELDLQRITLDRGQILSNDAIADAAGYKRYALNESGVSPRILPGLSQAVLYADSDEHTEEGHITESSDLRNKMMNKRMKKLEGMKQEMKPPEIYPSGKADLALLGWGSTYGAIKEAVDILNDQGITTQMIHFSEVYPLNVPEIRENVGPETQVFCVEQNYNGQFAGLFRSATGIPIVHTILKYDGRPFTPQEIAAESKANLTGD